MHFKTRVSKAQTFNHDFQHNDKERELMKLTKISLKSLINRSLYNKERGYEFQCKNIDS